MNNNIIEQLDKEYTEITDIRSTVRYSRRKGSHFFDNETMRFFDSEIHGNILKSKDDIIFFVTSEINPENKKRYTVRIMKPGASFTSTPKFFYYETLDEAYKAMLIHCSTNVLKERDSECDFCKELNGFYKVGEKIVMCDCKLNIENK